MSMSSKPTDTRITKFAASAVTIASGNSTQIGENIPTDKTRYVIGMVISADAAQKLKIMLGDTADPDRETLAILELAGTNPLTLGSFDPEKPLFVCRPERATGGTTITKNVLGIAHETSAINCTFVFYDAA